MQHAAQAERTKILNIAIAIKSSKADAKEWKKFVKAMESKPHIEQKKEVVPFVPPFAHRRGQPIPKRRK